jgi:hypothetical protein
MVSSGSESAVNVRSESFLNSTFHCCDFLTPFHLTCPEYAISCSAWFVVWPIDSFFSSDSSSLACSAFSISGCKPYHLSMFPRELGSNLPGSPEDNVMKGEHYEAKGQISIASNQNRRASGS